MSGRHFTLLGMPAGFARPELLWLSLAILVAGTIAVALLLRRRSRLSQWIDSSHAARLAPGRSRARTVGKAALGVIGLVLMSAALARPQLGARQETIKRRGIDVVVALDASRSMLATDVAPTRMARAKLELETLLAGLEGDRVGLVTFAGSAFVQMPLTSDYAAAQLFLRAVDPSAMPEGGTDIGGALRLAKEVLDQADHGAHERAVVLLSDGEDWGADAASAAESLRKAGIHTFAVGIGSPAGAPVPVVDARGVQRGYVEDADGRPVLTRLDREGLTKIAHAGGGEAFWQPRGVAIGEVVRRIEAMQKSELADTRVTSYVERFQWLLAPGLALLVLGMWLPPSGRRRPRRARRPTAAAAALLLLAFAPGRAHAAALLEKAEPATARGLSAYARGDYAAALQAFDEAAHQAPSAAAEYDRGTALYKLGRFADAKQAFTRALALQPGSKTLYDLGNSLAALDDTKGAIDAYRRALVADPTAEPARHNLELLLRKQEQQKKQEQSKNDPQKKKDDKDKKAGGAAAQKPQQQAGNDKQKSPNNRGSDGKQQQQHAGNDPKREGKPGTGQSQPEPKSGSEGKPREEAAGDPPKPDAPKAPAASEPSATAGEPRSGAPTAEARSTDRAAQAQRDARLSPDSARVLDAMRATERTLPLSRFAPPAQRRSHGKDW